MADLYIALEEANAKNLLLEEERAQLRAELAAAKEKMQEGEGDCRFCRDLEGDSKYPCTCGWTYGALATAYGNALQERTALAAHVERLCNALEWSKSYWPDQEESRHSVDCCCPMCDVNACIDEADAAIAAIRGAR